MESDSGSYDQGHDQDSAAESGVDFSELADVATGISAETDGSYDDAEADAAASYSQEAHVDSARGNVDDAFDDVEESGFVHGDEYIRPRPPQQ